MSAWAQRPADVLHAGSPVAHATRSPGALWLRLLTFFAATALASLAYATLLRHPPAARALAVAAAATATGAALSLGGSLLAGRGARRASAHAAGVAVSLLVALLALALGLLAVGVPAHLVLPWHWGALARAVERGVAGLHDWRWPYLGGSQWARLSVLMLLVPATTLMALLCFWPAHTRAGARRLIALAIAVALALCGMANAPAGAWQAQGVLLVALVFAWLWLPTLRGFDAGRALGWTLACALAALAAAPLLGGAHAWIPFTAGEGAQRTAFEWDQLYGPIGWSQSHQPMLTVRASTAPGLLRVTSLDRFDGLRFIRSDSPPFTTFADLAAQRREASWFQHDSIVVDGLRSSLLVGGSGIVTSFDWQGARRSARTLMREPDGTLAAPSAPAAGASYRVVSYAPKPTPEQMRAAPRTPPRAYAPYTEFELPTAAASALRAPDLTLEASLRPSAPVRTPAFGAAFGSGAGAGAGAEEALSARRIASSPYAPMYALARRLAAGARTSYDVVSRIGHYLLSNYTYDEHPPLRRYPLEAFLFTDRRGYCEQFSGAMTLMLRMDGIPARVGVGFKPELFDAATSTWTVRAADAHAWVEVFFTGIGWVSFDPTPATHALGSGSSATTSKGALLDGAQGTSATHALRAHTARSGERGRGARAAFALAAWQLALALIALSLLALWLLALWMRAHRRRRPGSDLGPLEEAVCELEGALAAMTWPLAPGMTLTQVAKRFERSAQHEAAAYVVLLRDLRFGRPRALGERDLSALRSQRLALRRALARGRGLRGWLRALRLLPPRALRF
jgi:transglutaminase-like putative cysteine protease